jgi:Protein of unknown function (DUF2934)
VEEVEMETLAPSATVAAIEVETAAVAYAPTSEAIALEAYLYWETRGCRGGSSEEDWLRAERELRSRTATA